MRYSTYVVRNEMHFVQIISADRFVDSTQRDAPRLGVSHCPLEIFITITARLRPAIKSSRRDNLRGSPRDTFLRTIRHHAAGSLFPLRPERRGVKSEHTEEIHGDARARTSVMQHGNAAIYILISHN